MRYLQNENQSQSKQIILHIPAVVVAFGAVVDSVIADNGMVSTLLGAVMRSGSLVGHNVYAMADPLPGDGLTRLKRPTARSDIIFFSPLLGSRRFALFLLLAVRSVRLLLMLLMVRQFRFV